MHVGSRKLAPLARLASRMTDAWRQGPWTNSAALPAVPQEAWCQVNRLHRLLTRAIAMRLPLAATRLRRELSGVIDRQQQQLHELREGLAISTEVAFSAHDLFLDLQALEREFPQVSCHPSRGMLSVTTEPIELQQVLLGSFRIELSWQRPTAALAAPAAVPARRLLEFEVVAVTPHLAGTSDYPHPHVDGTTLCAGDGRSSIQLALKQLRLFDFFVLVRQILMTYNPGSAYVTLDNWDGVECWDCGDSVSETAARSCCGCDGTLCEDCHVTCDDCDQSFCADCSFRCSDCDHQLCSTCLSRCGDCGKPLCRKCLIHDNCFTCDEMQETGEIPRTQDACA